MVLDEFQKEVIRSKEKNILVVASPGSGKTTVIVNRAGLLIYERGASPHNIIIITFTKAAAQNMKLRFKKLFPGIGEPFFGTFHALFYSILKKHRGDFNIISSSEAYFNIEKTLRKYMGEVGEDRVKDILGHISAYKTGFKTLEQLGEVVSINVLKQCIKSYEEFKRERSLLDFDDLQIETLELFNNNEKVLQAYRQKFKYLLVDEFQDCDSIQIDLLKKLSENNSIFAVGDEDQCIYSFRGARPDFMVSFSDNFENGTKKFLTNNYRSVKNVVEISSTLISNNIVRNDKYFSAARGYDGYICCERYTDERKQGEGIAEKIMKEVGEDICTYKDNAVLYRTNIEARALIDSFIKRKVPFILSDKTYNFFNHFICKDLLSYINLAVDLTSLKDFRRIINKPFRYISKVNLEKVSVHKLKEDCFDIICKIPSLPFFQYKELMKLRKVIVKLKEMETGFITEYILKSLNYRSYLEEYCSKYRIDIEDIDEIVEEFHQSISSFKCIEDFLIHVKKIEEELKKPETEGKNAVLMSTIHGVKGMEFKNVFIVNCLQGSIPYCRGENFNNIEEERRLFYVGITRAKDNLYLCWPLSVRGKARAISQFIKESGIKNIISLDTEYNLGDIVNHNSFGEGIISSIDEKEIGIKFEGNIIRHFDKNKLISHNLLKKMA